jgi:RND superfamily putative drug exporter
MAYGGVAAVLIAVLASVTALPALLAVLGPRIDAAPVRRARRPARHASLRPGGWERVARVVMRHPWRVVLLVVPVLVLLGVPFLHAQLGGADYRALPARAESRGVAQQLRADFPQQGQSVLTVAITSGAPASSAAVRREVRAYLQRVARVPGIEGTTMLGQRGHLTAAALDLRDDPQTLSARRTLARVRAESGPPGTQVLIGGDTARSADLLGALHHRLPLMIAWIVMVTLVLLFLAFGSLVVPLKALAMNVLSLSAAFGSLVWIFQDGHAAGLLNFTPSGYLEASQPLLLFTVAFGLSMDYEVFLLSRIREHYDQTGNNTEAVAVGLQRTGRLISCAAVLLGAVLAAFTTSEIVYSKMLGLGIILALIIDATIVRSLLVPATMRLMGRANWWAPGPLLRFWERYGISETDEPDAARPAPRLPAGPSARSSDVAA